MLPIWVGGMLQTLEPWKEAREVAAGLLKAKMAITRMGRYKKAKTSTAQTVKPSLALGSLRTELLLLSGEEYVDGDEHRQHNHQPDRQGRAEWLVLSLVELITDDVPDKLVVPAAQDVGDDVLAGHRNENQERSGHHPGQGEPQGDLAESGKRSCTKIGSCLDQPPVHPLQRGEHRQDEQRQVVVDQPHRDR